jgi:formylglycine-generating enzyme required for sulfatase activity
LTIREVLIMKRDTSGFGKFSVLLLTVAIVAFSIIYFFSATTASALTPQGGGGRVQPTPTPKKTTVPKKTTTPAKTNRTGALKPPARKAEPEAAKPSAAEIAFWETIKDSKNPEEFRAYLKKYPNGEFADLARGRLNALEAAAKEDAALREEAKKAARRPGAVVKNQMGMEFVSVPAGTFMMGSSDAEAQAAYEEAKHGNKDAKLEWYTTEKPKHQVTFREGFYMGRYEVTQAQWQAVMGNNPSDFKDCDQCPVDRVTWNDVQEFIRRLNAHGDGFTYRLPSEAEWEYACRAGTTGDFAGYPDAMAWYYKNSGLKTHPVGQKQPNAFGLYDMHGNVWEMCEDWHHDSYSGAPTDGSAWLNGGEQKRRLIRGGSYANFATGLRSPYRGSALLDLGSLGWGFRVVAVARTQ